MKPSEIIKKGWCKGAAARDAWGKDTYLTHEQAESWSVLGAIMYAFTEPKQQDEAADALLRHLGINAEGFPENWIALGQWNEDRRTRDEVVAALEAAGL